MPDPAFWLIMIAVVGVFIAGAVLSWLTGRFGEQRVNIVASALIAGVSYAASILVAFGLAAAGAEESTIMAVALFVWMGGIAGLLMLRSRIDLKTAVCIAALFGAVYVGYALAADLLLEPLFETLRQSAE